MTSTEAGSSHTNWALIFDAAQGKGLPAATALERLVRRYWPAVYAYVRSSGRDIHEAADLTQSFVCEVILGRKLFQKADPKRGRFRNLLLSALQNYLRERHRHDTRKKRSAEHVELRMTDEDIAAIRHTDHLTPEQAFSAQWHATMLRQVLERVRLSCRAAGLETHWHIFEARVVNPMLTGQAPVPYAELVDCHDLSDAGQAANMIVTVKRRFIRALLEEIAGTVDDPIRIEEELRSLLQDVESHR